MTSPVFEAFLARLYVEEETRRRFLADPRGTAATAGLSVEECEVLSRIDRADLELAALSFARKREQQVRRRRSRWTGTAWWRW